MVRSGFNKSLNKVYTQRFLSCFYCTQTLRERTQQRTYDIPASPVLHSLLDVHYKLHMQQAVFHHYHDAGSGLARCRGDDLLGIYADAFLLRTRCSTRASVSDEFQWLSGLPFKLDYLNWLREFRQVTQLKSVSSTTITASRILRLTGPWREVIMWKCRCWP